MPRQLIHLIGGLVTALVLVLGIVTVTLPMLSQSASTHAQADQVAQTNAIYDAQLQALRAQQADFDTLRASLTELHAGIPDAALNDQVFEIIVDAALAARVTIVSASASEPTLWTPDVPQDAPAPAPESVDPTGDPDPTAASTDTTTRTATDSALSPERIVPFTLEVIAPDGETATAFLDQLRTAARLVRIDRAEYTGEEDPEDPEETVVRLKIQMHSFIYLVENREARR